MIVVYWLTHSAAGGPRAMHACFAQDELAAALRLAEDLRAQRRGGAAISHVAIQSELPESVGQPGVGDAPPGYSHYKRRLDPKTPLGRPRRED